MTTTIFIVIVAAAGLLLLGAVMRNRLRAPQSGDRPERKTE